ncbi:hypothetical protein HanRHA438_Chr08g0346671 [Helianthus annuus]|nr:hypothetical protein HanRHA438_Chr08g0346671 [Helianthus annuus]
MPPLLHTPPHHRPHHSTTTLCNWTCKAGSGNLHHRCRRLPSQKQKILLQIHEFSFSDLQSD